MGKTLVDSPTVAIVDDELDGLRITIRSHRVGPLDGWTGVVSVGLMTLFVWLGMFIKGPAPVGPGSVVSQRTAATLYMVALLVIPACVSPLAIFCLWQFRSVDTVILNDRALILRRELGPLHQTFTFDSAEVRDVRHFWEGPIRSVNRLSNPRDLGVGGMVAFDVRDKTYRFGLDLSAIETVRILEAMKSSRSDLVSTM